MSYYEYLVQSSFSRTATEHETYDPGKLDNPDLKYAVKSKKVIVLPGYVSTVFQYTRPQDLKKEINSYFRETHPHVDPSISLSKIRTLKQRLTLVSKAMASEYSNPKAIGSGK